MRKYPCKKEISDAFVENKMRDVFRNVKKEDGAFVSSISALTVRAYVSGKKELSVETETSPSSDQEMLIKLYNKFIEDVTGYSAKERKKMVSKI
ncbi:MAG: DUF5611 family protein [Thermoplasmatales archaeon]